MSAPTRDRILDAAWARFVRQGYAGTTVTQIEADAELAAGRGSFYRHFRSKEDVLQAVVDREVDRIDRGRDVGPELTDVGGDVRVALALEFQRRLTNLRRMQPLVALVGREHEHLGESRDHLRERLVARNLGVRTERLAELMATGAIPARDPNALAATILCALTGYHLSVGFFGKPSGGIGEDEFIAMLVELVAGGDPAPR